MKDSLFSTLSRYEHRPSMNHSVMTCARSTFRSVFKSIGIFAAGALAVLNTPSTALAVGTPTIPPVVYSPLTNPAGNLAGIPLGNTVTYGPVTITSPNLAFPTGPGSTFHFHVATTSWPGTIDPLVAATFVTLTPVNPSLTAFTAANQSVDFMVTVSFASPAAVAGTYAFTVTEDNWPFPASAYENIGYQINATSAPVPPPSHAKPTVTISAPVGSPPYTFLLSELGVRTIPLNFQVQSPANDVVDPTVGLTALLGSNQLPLSALIIDTNTTTGGIQTLTGHAALLVTSAGANTVTVTAGNLLGGNSTVVSAFSVVVQAPPVIALPNTTNFTVNQAGSFTVVATGSPTPTFSISGQPSWLSLNATTGALTGTPPASAAGTSFTFVITAANGVGTNATQNFTLNVQSPPVFTSVAQATFTVGQSGSFIVTASGSPLPTLSAGSLPAGITFTAGNGTGQGTLSGTPTNFVGSPFTLTFAANNGVGSPPTQTFTLTILAAPTITTQPVSSIVTAGQAVSFSVVATGNPATFTYQWQKNGVNIAGATGATLSLATVSSADVGNYTVVVTNSVASVTSNVATLSVKATQTITFGALPAKIVGAAPFALTATASSGLPVSYASSNPSVATVSGSTVTILSAGTTTITASQAGNTSFNAATPVSQTLTVTAKQNQTITFGALPAKVVGDVPFALTATASSGLPVSYASSNPSVATVSGSTVTILSAGTTTITASQAGNTSFNAATPVPQTLTVTAKQNQTITFGALPAKKVGDAPFALTATASSGLPVSYASSNPSVATVSASTVTILSAGTTTITASQAGNTSFNAATPVPQTLTVTAAQTCTTTVVWLPPISLGKVQQGGSVLPIKFLLQECCPASGSGNNVDERDDDGSWSHGHGWDDNNGWGDDNGRGNDFSGTNVACHHGRDGKSTDNSNCRHDCSHDQDDSNGCANLRDQTVVISIYAVGSGVPATQYPYGPGSPNPPDYSIDGDYQYQLNFPTAKGVHVYHIDVYRYPPGATSPVLVGSKEFSTK